MENKVNMTLQQLADSAAKKFAEAFGRAPRWIAAAPGRVNLIGEHTDYNDGFVLPMAIDRYTVVAADRPASARSPTEAVLVSRLKPDKVTFPLGAALKRGEPAWTNYVRGVMAGFQDLGCELGSLDVLVESSVPLGGGLSSSAALEVATATLLEAVTGRKLEPVQKALLCQKAEHTFAGVPCGIMDQFTSVMGKEGHLLLLDCRSRATELVPLAEANIAVLIINTNVKHELANGEYAQRRRQCETAAGLMKAPSLREVRMEDLARIEKSMDPVVFRRAKHVIGEIERTVQAAREIRNANWQRVGELMYASHHSLRDDYEVSCAELDYVVELASGIGNGQGVIGCRMTGGGFGGCAVSLARTDAIPEISEQIGRNYRQKTGIAPSLFVTRPAAGATLIQE